MNKFRSFMTSHTTLVAALALALGVLLTLAFTPRHDEGVAPPQVAEQRSVAGVCSLVVTGYDGAMWAAPLGGGQVKPVDPAWVGVTGCRTDPDPSR